MTNFESLDIIPASTDTGPHTSITQDPDGKITQLDIHYGDIRYGEEVIGIDFVSFQKYHPGALIDRQNLKMSAKSLREGSRFESVRIAHIEQSHGFNTLNKYFAAETPGIGISLAVGNVAVGGSVTMINIPNGHAFHS